MRLRREIWILAGLIGSVAAALLPQSWWRVLIMVLFTGFAPIALTRIRWSLVSLPLASIAAGLPLWGIISLVAWKIDCNQLIAWAPSAIALGCFVCSLFLRNKYLSLSRWSWADFYACVLIVLVGIPHVLIQQVNGIQPGEQGPEFQARLYITNDSLYVFALAQAAKEQQQYPPENPYLAGYPNVYPSLLQCGLGGLTQLGGPICGLIIWPIYPWLILPGIGLVYLALHRLCPRRNKWPTLIFTLAYAAFVAFRVDHYLFLQTVALSLPLLGLMLCFYPGTSIRPNWHRWIIYTSLLLLLTASHTVTAITGLAIVAGIGLRQLLRKPFNIRCLAPVVLSLAVVLPVFLWMNYHPSVISLPGEIPNDLKWELVKVMVIYYLFPFAFIPVFARVRFGTVHPLAVAAWLLLAATIAYWLSGYYKENETSVVFALYNAPRFAVNALMLISIFYTVNMKKGTIVAGLFWLYIAVIPSPVGGRNHEFVTAKPYIVPLAEIFRVYNSLPTSRLQSHRVITSLMGYAVSAFTGYAQTLPDSSYYSIGTISDQDLAQLTAERQEFFTRFTPEQRLEYMKKNNIDALVMNRLADGSSDSGFLPEGAAQVHVGNISLVYVLNP